MSQCSLSFSSVIFFTHIKEAVGKSFSVVSLNEWRGQRGALLPQLDGQNDTVTLV